MRLPLLAGDAADVFGAVVAEEAVELVHFGMVMLETAFALYAQGLQVVGEVAAPQCVQAQAEEGVPHHFAHCFGHQAAPPVRYADPVGDLAFALADLEVAVGTDQDADAADGAAIFAALQGIDLRPVEHGADDLGTFLDAGVGWPSGDGPDAQVAGVFVQVGGVGVAPGAQNQAFGVQLHVDSKETK